MNVGRVIKYYERTVRDMSTISSYLPSIDKARYVEKIDKLTKMILKITDKEGYNKGWEDLIRTKESLRSAVLVITPNGVDSMEGRNFLFNKMNDYFRVVGWFIYRKLGYPVPDSPWRLNKDEAEDESRSEEESKSPPDIMGISGMEFGGEDSFPD